MAGSCREWLGRTARRIATDATWVFVIVMSLSIGSTFFSIRYLSGLESDLGELYENDVKGRPAPRTPTSPSSAWNPSSRT